MGESSTGARCEDLSRFRACTWGIFHKKNHLPGCFSSGRFCFSLILDFVSSFACRSHHFVRQLLCNFVGLGTGSVSTGNTLVQAVRLSWLRGVPGFRDIGNLLTYLNTPYNTKEIHRNVHTRREGTVLCYTASTCPSISPYTPVWPYILFA